jgi:TP901 family phage tail tape measure protein
MGIGVGGGANLGSATAYLFVDPGGVARGLRQAAAEFNRFEKATERLGTQTSRAASAAAEAERFKKIASPANLQALKANQAATQAALTAATRTFGEEHRKRKQILDGHVNTISANEKKIQTIHKATEALNRQRLSDNAKLIRSEQNLAKAQSAGITNKRRLGGYTGAVTRDKNILQKSENAIKSLEVQAAAASAAIVGSGEATAEALAASYAAERRAIDDLNTSLTKQNVLRKSLAKEAGVPALSRFADDAAKSSQKYVRSVQSMLTVDDQLAKVRTKMAATIDPGIMSTLAAREEQLVQRRAKIADLGKQHYASLAAADAAYTNELTVQTDKRIALAEKERAAQALIQKEQGRMAKQRAIGTALDVGVKGALGLGVVIGAATAAFVSFESAMLAVQSVTQDTDATMDQLTEGVRELSVQLGISPTELAEGLYSIAQAGFTGADALGILEISARGAVAGFTSVETAARPLIAVLSAFPEGMYTAQKASDILFESVTAGVFTFEDLASQLGDNVPLAAQMGVSLEELAASYIVLTKQGNSLSESTTQVNGILRAFLKPTASLQKVVEDAGFATGALAVEELGLAGAMELAVQAADGNNDALADMFPLIRGLRGVVALSTDDWKQYDAAMSQVSHASDGVGRTQETLATQMQSTARQLAIAREEIRGAAIELGGNFAPAVVNLAQVLGAAANAVADFNQETGGAAANMMTFGFGVSVAVVGLAKIISIGTRTAQVYRDLADAISKSGRAMSLLRMSPLLLVLGGIAAVTAHLIKAHRDHAQAVKDLAQSYKDATAAIEAMKLAGADPKDIEAQTNLEKNFKDTTEAIAERKKMLEGLLATQSQLRQEMDPNLTGGPDVKPIVDFIDSLEKELADLDIAEGKLAAGHKRMIEALGMQNVDIPLLTGVFTRLNEELARTGDVDAWNAAIEATIGNIGIFVDEEKLATKETGDLGDEFEGAGEKFLTVSEFFKEATSNTEAFRESVAGMIATAREMAGIDIATDDPFGVIKATKGLKSANVFDLLLDLTKRRETDLINLDPVTKQAFQLADQLERVVVRMARLDERIQANSDDMSMWQGRIDLVNDTLGENTDTMGEWEAQLAAGEITQEEFNEAVSSGEAHTAMAELDKLLNEGRISQKQYNDIKEAGIYLLERSAGALQDERAEQALLLPKMAEYVKQHDDISGQLGDLDAASQARVAALQSEAGQMAINTAVMLRMLEVMKLIPEGTALKFMTDLATDDPVIGALLEDIGLLKAESPIELEFNVVDEAAGLQTYLDNVKQKIIDLGMAYQELGIKHKTGEISDEAFLEGVADYTAQLDALTQEKHIIELTIATGGGPKELEQVGELINSIKETKAGFSIDVDSKEAAAQLRELLNIEIGDKRFKITIDGIAGEESLDKELKRRMEKALLQADLEIANTDIDIGKWREWVLNLGKGEEQLRAIEQIIQAFTGQEGALSVGVNTKAAESAILFLTGYIDQTLLTEDFMIYLDANNDGVLDATELARLATEGFEGVYTAYLVAEATEAQKHLEEVDGVKTEVMKDGTLKITADSEEALAKFQELNEKELDGKTYPIDVEIRMGSDIDATGIPELGGAAAEGEAGAEGGMEIPVRLNKTQFTADLNAISTTDIPNATATATTAATTMGSAIDTGISTGAANAKTNTETAMTGVVAAMDRSAETWNVGFNTGWNLGDGIRAGIEATVGAIAAAAANAVNTAEAAARTAADSKSPSKLFAKLGHDLMRGMAMGVQESERALSSAIYGSVSSAFTGAVPATGWKATGMAAGQPLAPAMVAGAGGGTVYNVSMDVVVPAANFKEWIGTVQFVQDIKSGFGTTLAGSRSR